MALGIGLGRKFLKQLSFGALHCTTMRKTFQMQGSVDKEGYQMFIKVSLVFAAFALYFKDVNEDLASEIVQRKGEDVGGIVLRAMSSI
jgi:hypothetical protein